MHLIEIELTFYKQVLKKYELMMTSKLIQINLEVTPIINMALQTEVAQIEIVMLMANHQVLGLKVQLNLA